MSFLAGTAIATIQSLVAPSRAMAGFLKQEYSAITKLPRYVTNIDPKPGDIFIHCAADGYVGHANMIADQITDKVDSVPPNGVRNLALIHDKHRAIVYRFKRNDETALRAAKLAVSWAVKQSVGYSDSNTFISEGAGFLSSRQLGFIWGGCNWGKGAQGRLQKYLGRGKTPRNVTCAEMCILAYQLNMSENDPDFIKLDAKYTSPTRLMQYFEQEGKMFWDRISLKPERSKK